MIQRLGRFAMADNDRALFWSNNAGEQKEGEGGSEDGSDKGHGFFGKVKGFIKENIGFGKPTAHVSGFHLPSITLDQADVVVDVMVTNPNPIPIPLVDINYVMESNGRKLASGTIPDAGTLRAHGSETLNIKTRIIYKDIKETYHDIHPGEVIPYKVKVELVVDVPVFGRLTLPLEKTGEIPVPYKPEVDVDHVEFNQLSAEESSATLHLKVGNRNKFKLGIRELEYSFGLAGTPVASTRLSKSSTIEEQGVGSLEIPISFRPKDLGSAMWGIICGKGAGYSMAGKLEVDTPFGPMHLPFSKEGGKTILKRKAGSRAMDANEVI